MIRLLAPNEMLRLLYMYLVRGKRRESKYVFRKFSQPNQFRTFMNMLNAPDIKAYHVGEYIVVFTKDRIFRRHVFVIGLDDNYSFFCHNLPMRSAFRLNPSKLSPRMIRNEMGFDYHIWEISEMRNIPNARIRLQGDIVVTIERTFKTDEELYFYLYTMALKNFLNRYMSNNIFPLASIIKKVLSQNRSTTVYEFWDRVQDYLFDLDIPALSRISEKLKSILSTYSIRTPSMILSMFNTKGYHIDEIIRILDTYLRDIITDICNSERILNIRIGNHRIKIIGVNESDLARPLIDTRPLISRNRLRIYVLRPHVMSAFHDEHRHVSLDIPRCIMTLSTLRTGPFHVARRRLTPPLTTSYTIIHRVKVVIIDFCGIHPSKIIPNFDRRWYGHLETLGATFGAYRELVSTPYATIQYEFWMWYTKTNTRHDHVIPLYCRGARAFVIIVDMSNTDTILMLLEHLRNLGILNFMMRALVIIAGCRANCRNNANCVSSDALHKVMRELSRITIFPPRFFKFDDDCSEQVISILIESQEKLTRLMLARTYRNRF